MSKKITLNVYYPEHDIVVLTNVNGDTYTSKSEELQDFLHDGDNLRVSRSEQETAQSEETPEQVFDRIVVEEGKWTISPILRRHCIRAMEEFAKGRIEVELEAAAERATVICLPKQDVREPYEYVVDKNSITDI